MPPDSGAGEPITLPDVWGERRPDARGYGWYQFDWMPDNDASQPVSVYFTAINVPAQLYLNGALVGATGPLLGQRPRTWEQSQAFAIQGELLHPGNNTLEVRVFVADAQFAGIGPILVGSDSAIRKVAFVDLARHTLGPAVVTVAVIVVGIYIMALWLRRPEPAYALFGAGAIVWGLHTGISLLPKPILPQPHWTVWWHAIYLLFVVLLCSFCLRFAGVRWPKYQKTLIAYGASVVPVLYVAHRFDALFEATAYVRLGAIALVFVALAAVARYAVRVRNTESLLLFITGAVSTGFAVHDWVMSRDPLALRPVWLVPYAALAFLMLVGWILTDRFIRALNEAEQLNVTLEERVAAKGAALAAQLEETRTARDAAERANRAKSRFLAAASHDLRQPLHAIGLIGAALADKVRDQTNMPLVQQINTSVASLDALFAALLDVSKLDAGVIEPDVRHIELDGMFERVANDFAAEALERNLKLGVVRTSCVARTDPVLLERILRNLLANAIRYTVEGGVILGCRWRGGQIAIEVWDSGPGIPAHELDRIFEEFYQIGNPERDRTRGLGLGLAIVRRLAALLGHEVQVQSWPGRGSMFRVILERGDRHSITAPVEESVQIMGPMAGRTVLVVDDEAPIREGMRELLNSWGCSVVTAGSAEDALASLGGIAPDACVMDYRLRGGVDGLTALARLNAALHADLPSVLVSGESSPEELASIKHSGLPLLHKPVSPSRLRSVLAHLLSRQASTAS